MSSLEYKPPVYGPPTKKPLRSFISPWLVTGILRYSISKRFFYIAYLLPQKKKPTVTFNKPTQDS